MIRKALFDEIETLLTITKACARKMIADGIYQWNEHYPSAKAFHTDYKRGELYVLEQNKEIIGCITISQHKDAEYDEIKWLRNDGNNYYVHRLAIHPNQQCKGHAKKLMDFAESHALNQGADSIRLDTFSQNRRNQRFYEARGYTRLDKIYFPKQSEYPFFCYEKLLKLAD